ncbi:MAG: efflux RND transporter permease subunit [Methylohalobius sp. ZOD2]
MVVEQTNGARVPFSQVADGALAPGAATIERRDRRRQLRVSADAAGGDADVERLLDRLNNQVFPRLEQRFPGLEIEFGERRREQGELMNALKRYSGLALIGIYTLLAVALGSYMRPLLIMAVIPFSFVGVAAAHWLLSVDLTLYVLFSTLVTLILVPVLYLIGEDIRATAARRSAPRPPRVVK